MREKVIALIEESLEMVPGDLSPEDKIKDIPEWDSLKFLMIIADLEDELGVVVPIEKADEIETVEDILSFIEE